MPGARTHFGILAALRERSGLSAGRLAWECVLARKTGGRTVRPNSCANLTVRRRPMSDGEAPQEPRIASIWLGGSLALPCSETAFLLAMRIENKGGVLSRGSG